MSPISIDFYRNLATKFLDKRYNLCNRNGRRKVVDGVCTYCFRHHPQTERQKMSDKNKGLVILIDSLKELNLNK